MSKENFVDFVYNYMTTDGRFGIMFRLAKPGRVVLAELKKHNDKDFTSVVFDTATEANEFLYNLYQRFGPDGGSVYNDTVADCPTDPQYVISQYYFKPNKCKIGARAGGTVVPFSKKDELQARNQIFSGNKNKTSNGAFVLLCVAILVCGVCGRTIFQYNRKCPKPSDKEKNQLEVVAYKLGTQILGIDATGCVYRINSGDYKLDVNCGDTLFLDFNKSVHKPIGAVRELVPASAKRKIYDIVTRQNQH